MSTRRQTLEGALVKAEASLHSAVTKLANASGDRTAASEGVDRVRASCREAHAALKKLKHSEH